MEEFKLPRNDWFDSDGRIYKDALIENFNAIEKAFLELTNLGAIDIQNIDWDNVHLEDVTLDSADNKIVNLNSLLNILHISKMYFGEQFESKKCVSINYFKDGKIAHIQNQTLGNLTEGDFIWLSVANDNLEIVKPANLTSKFTSDTTGILVGQYINGTVQTNSAPRYINYNVLQPLSRMKVTPVPFYNELNKNSQQRDRSRFSGRRLGYTLINKRAGSMIRLTMPDSGYQGDGTR